MSDEKELEEFNGEHKKCEQQAVKDPLLEGGIMEIKKACWTLKLAFAGYAATTATALPAGYCIGVMNSPAVHMRSWCNSSLIERYNVYLTPAAMDILWSSIVSIFLIGGAIGSLSGAWTANKFGRKGSILGCGLLFIIAAICFFACRPLNSFELLLLGRLIVGLASGLAITCLPMYLSEIAPLALRGTLGVFSAVGITGGVVVGQIFSLRSIFGSAEQWHIALCFYVVLVIVCLIPYTYYPESPKWLYIVKKNSKAAKLELSRLRSANETHLIEQELEYMEMERKASDQTSSFMEALLDPKLLLPLVIVAAYHGGQQLSGINAIFFYSVSIFRKAGLSTEAAEWANLGAGSLNLAVSSFGPLLMAKYNRRPLMLFSSFCCSFALLAFAVMLYFIESVSWFAFGCIFCIFLFIFFFQFGVGPIPFFIGSELFEVAPRPVAMSIGSLSNFMCNFIVSMTFPSLQSAWGALVFLPFAITCALLFFLTLFYVPETKGRSPTEVAVIVSKGFKSKVK